MSQVASIPSDVKTLIDVRVASNEVIHGQIKIVKGIIDGEPDYAIFADDEYIGSFEASTEPQAVWEGLAKIRELLEYLRLSKGREALMERRKHWGLDDLTEHPF